MLKVENTLSGGVTLAENAKRLYEAMYLVDAAWATANWDELIKTLNTIMDRAEADVVNIRKWDERRLCYAVAGRTRGLYILSYFYVLPEKISQIERDVQLNEMLLRLLILRAEHVASEAMEAPTPALSAEQNSQKEPAKPTPPAQQSESVPAEDAEKTEKSEQTDFDAIAAIDADIEPAETETVVETETQEVPEVESDELT